MKIENRTKWQTGHLRAIASRVLVDVLDPEKRKQTWIVFDTARGSSVTGYAYYRQIYRHHQGPYWVAHIRVPSPYGLRARILATHVATNATYWGTQTEGPRIVDKVELASVIAHETGHFGGRRNRDLRGSHIHDASTPEAKARFAWAADMPLEPAEKKVAPDPCEANADGARPLEATVSPRGVAVGQGGKTMTPW